MKQQSIIYYGARLAHRVALCGVVGATVIHWIILIATAVNIAMIGNLEDRKFKDSAGMNADIHTAINAQSLIVVRWVVVAAVVSGFLLLLVRYRKYEKPLIIDSLVIMGFCLVSVVFSQPIVRAFIAANF